METFTGVLPVAWVSYTDHEKRGKPDAPHSVRVEYCTSPMMGQTVTEYICPEHKSMRRRFEHWWEQRASGLPAPSTVAQVVYAGTHGLLLQPAEIYCTIDDEKLDKIHAYRFPAPGEALPTVTPDTFDDDYNDILF